MNNTRILAIVAVLTAATLVVGGTSAAMTTGHSAFAWKQDSYKKRGDDSYKKRGDDSYKKRGDDSYKKRGDDSYKKDKQDGYKKQRQDTYMKGGENSYKKVRQSKGIYGNGNTETIQATTQNGQVRGSHNTLEQEASNVICTHPSATCSQDGSEASVASNDNGGTNRDNGDNGGGRDNGDNGGDKDPHNGDKFSIW
jgi:uncharacterized protein YxeA